MYGLLIPVATPPKRCLKVAEIPPIINIPLYHPGKTFHIFPSYSQLQAFD